MFEAARLAVPLPELWRQYGLPLARKSEQRFASPYTPCCGEATRDDAGSVFLRRDGTWVYHCFRCGKGGSAIDLVAQMESLTPYQAAKKLVEDAGGIKSVTGREPPNRAPRVSVVARRQAIAKVVDQIRRRDVIDPKVRDYLCGVRGFSEKVLCEAQSRSFLRTLPGLPDAADVWLRLSLTDDVLRTAGLMKVGANAPKRPAAAYRPVVFLPPRDTCIEFRTISTSPNGPKALQYGEQTYPLLWKPTGDVRKILVVEGGFDVLAAVDLGFATNTMIVGQFGTSAWQAKWSLALVQKYPKAKWQIGTDHDNSGEGAYPAFAEQLSELGASHERLTPWGGGVDWNDTLLAAREL